MSALLRNNNFVYTIYMQPFEYNNYPTKATFPNLTERQK